MGIQDHFVSNFSIHMRTNLIEDFCFSFQSELFSAKVDFLALHYELQNQYVGWNDNSSLVLRWKRDNNSNVMLLDLCHRLTR